LTILGRTIGMDIEGPPSSSIFPIESLIPYALESVKSGDEFVSGLSAHDAEFDEKRSVARREGNVLRYVGSIDVATKRIKVGLQSYLPFQRDVSHLDIPPHIHLHRCRARIISLHFILKDMETDHSSFREQGMSFSLAKSNRSAGAEVTAMGVMSDIFKCCERIF